MAIFISSRVPVPENNLTWFVGPAMRAMVPLLVVAVRKTLPSRNDTSIPRFFLLKLELVLLKQGIRLACHFLLVVHLLT